MERNKTAGISLVALVVTIIVLIILTGAVIVTFMDGGIIDRANESVFKNDIRTYQEQLVILRAKDQIAISTNQKDYEPLVMKENPLTEAEIKTALPEFNYKKYGTLVQIVDGKLVAAKELSEDIPEEKWLLDLGFGASAGNTGDTIVGLNIGDTVAYTPNPNGDINEEWKFENDEPIVTDTSLQWKYLGYINGQHMLISDKTTKEAWEPDSIGYYGYNYEMAEYLYSGEGGEATHMDLNLVCDILEIDRPISNEDKGNLIGKSIREVAPDANLTQIELLNVGEYPLETDYTENTRGNCENDCGEEYYYSTLGIYMKNGTISLYDELGYYCINCEASSTPYGQYITNFYGLRPVITIDEGYTIAKVSGQWTVVAK